ncbi:hypothetical protein GCM10011391_05470 [Pullulanibacillus camelliae]|uniref:EAL domain-containing protein n=1 Tax=Pullulanibacillus camelliae TaxID=1707096 RepID=A0A8J2VKX8_9BACL|nr:EAL domain-containing protein [Pullulanibacillus camelliae]GGE29846.1 hypothetical protein GCM10011391_05470 [Pullulanibacillus camelliae]
MLLENFMPKTIGTCLFDKKGTCIMYTHSIEEMLGNPQHSSSSWQSELYKQLTGSMDGEARHKVKGITLHRTDGSVLELRVLTMSVHIDREHLGMLCAILPCEHVMEEPDILTFNFDRAKPILDMLNVAIWIYDAEKQQMLYVSRSIQDIYEVAYDVRAIDDWPSFVHPDDLEEVLADWQDVIQGQSIVQQFRITTAKGQMKWLRGHVSPIMASNDQLRYIIGFIEDVTEAHVLQDRLIHLAYYNELTELPNRHRGRQCINQKIEESERLGTTFALLNVNLDRIKRINTAFGHDIGDEVIKKISERMKGFADGLGQVYHINGDEFIITLDTKHAIEQYYHLAQQLMTTIEDPIFVKGYDIYTTTSIGICVYPIDGRDYDTLIRGAHIALNRAKDLGKSNAQLYSAAMAFDEEPMKLFELETDLRKAIKDEELFFVYQPRVDTKTQKIVAAEALIRWKHPNYGMISPGVFIPMAEKTQLINDIGEFVLDSVCRQIQIWQYQGVPLHPISVNLSAKNFLKADFVKYIKSKLEQYQVDPAWLEIEITESALLLPDEVVLQQINKIKDLGISLALDDYGTGYSSINYIKRYAIDCLKIDQSFIQRINENEEDAVIVRTIIDMGKGLKKRVVAEGVETEAQHQLLRAFGCDEIQGYYFYRPVSVEAIGQLFQ